MDDTQQPAVQVTIRHGMSRGHLTREKLREALLLQEQLRAAGRPTPLLSVLASRFLTPDQVQELSRVYREALAQAQAFDASATARARAEQRRVEDDPTAAPVDVPAEVLARSCEMLELPPDRDPEPVKRFLRESELNLEKIDDIDDRVFVGLARKAGYPTGEELRGLAREQAERRARGSPPASLFILAVLRSVLDERRQKRFQRWAKQVADKDLAPIEEEEESAQAPPLPASAPPPPSLTGSGPPQPASAPPKRRVLAASAVDLAIPTSGCHQCGAPIEVLALLDDDPTDIRTLCTNCAYAQTASVPPGSSPSARSPLQPPPPAQPPKREGRAKRVAKAVRDSAAFMARGLVRKARPPAPGRPPEPDRAPRSLVVGLGVTTTAAALLLLALVASLLVRPTTPPPAPPVVATEHAADPRADAAWGALRGETSAAGAATALRRFSVDFPRDPRAVEAVLLAGLLDLSPGATTASAGAGVGDPLTAEAQRLAVAEPAAAAALADAALRLSPGHPAATRVRRQLEDAALRAVTELREELLAQARAGQGPAALRRAIDEAGRWRGLGQDAAYLGLVERLGRPVAEPTTPPKDPPPPVTPPPPKPTPSPVAPTAGPAPPRLTPPTAAPGPRSLGSLWVAAVNSFAEEDGDGLADAREELERAAPDAPETRAAQGFERYLAGQHAQAVEPLLAGVDLPGGWVAWTLVRAAFFAGRYADARKALGRLPEGAEQATWRLLIDGPFRDAAPGIGGACEQMSPTGRYRVMTDVGLDLPALEARAGRLGQEARDELIAKSRRNHRALAELADLMDKASRAYSNLLEAPPREQVVPTVYVLSDEARFHAFSKKLGMGDTENVLGFYAPSYRVLVFYEREPQREGIRALSAATQEVLLHESFHQWLRLHVADAPTWFDEGFAEYFAFSEVTKDSLRYGLLPARYPSRLDTIRRAIGGRDVPAPLPLQQLLVLDHPDFMAGEQVYTNYAHAWSFVHFLASSKPGQKVLRDYFGALREGKDLPAARDAAFGKVDLNQLDREWRAYVDRLKS